MPIAGLRCVKKIVTELAVLDVLPPEAGGGFLLREWAPGVSVAQFQAATAGRLELPAGGEVPEMRGV